MLAEILRRLMATVPVMGVVDIAVFALLHVTPGDPAVIIAGDYATTDDIARIRARLGLDQPFHTQVAIWLGRVVRGDLGTSIFSGLPVSTLIGQRAATTIWLTLFAMLISVGVGVPIGVVAAWRKGSWLDRAVMVFAVSGFSMPTFWLGFILVYVFAITAGWLPVQGYTPLAGGVGSFLSHLILPALTLSVVYMALIARMTRASMLGVLDEGLVAPGLWSGDPQQMRTAQRLQPPSAVRWFGSDHFGRDVYTRTLYGARVSLVVGAAVALVSLALGTTLGLVIGFYRRLDTVMMRVMDGLMAIPAILLALALMAMMRASVRNVIIALVIPEIPRVIRVVRASVLSLREHAMVEAARALGVGTPRILLFYILPALVAPLLVQATYMCASAILFEAYLSFLGARPPPHIPSAA